MRDQMMQDKGGYILFHCYKDMQLVLWGKYFIYIIQNVKPKQMSQYHAVDVLGNLCWKFYHLIIHSIWIGMPHDTYYENLLTVYSTSYLWNWKWWHNDSETLFILLLILTCLCASKPLLITPKNNHWQIRGKSAM